MKYKKKHFGREMRLTSASYPENVPDVNSQETSQGRQEIFAVFWTTLAVS